MPVVANETQHYMWKGSPVQHSFLISFPVIFEGKLLTLAQIRDGYEHKKGQGPADSLLE